MALKLDIRNEVKGCGIGTAKLALAFSENQNATERSRLSYAFSLFCGVYGHQPAIEYASECDVCLTYSKHILTYAKRVVYLSSIYRYRSLNESAPPPVRFSRGDLSTFLFYAPQGDAEPDWLGEIFEWVSCADEYSLEANERPSATTDGKQYVFRHQLDPYVPYAAVAMRFLEAVIQDVEPTSANEPIPVLAGVKHHVIVTHDVDYLPQGRWEAVARLVKNSAAALVVHRRPGLAGQLLLRAIQTGFGGRNPLDQIPNLISLEVARKISATYFIIPRRAHRRDGNYDIKDHILTDCLDLLATSGMEVGLHGSYSSMDNPPTLNEEFQLLRTAGCNPCGNRQHWLRFTMQRLIPELEAAGAAYDSSLGWSDSLGFRAGACFPFPPYYFAEERPARFLEIPLVVMDVALVFGRERTSPSGWLSEVSQVLDMSRRFGWGGIAILWHPTGFGGGQIPESIGDLFWYSADERGRYDESWTSASTFLSAVRSRYQQVGLMPVQNQNHI